MRSPSLLLDANVLFMTVMASRMPSGATSIVVKDVCLRVRQTARCREEPSAFHEWR
jgi:hypothetical protein